MAAEPGSCAEHTYILTLAEVTLIGLPYTIVTSMYSLVVQAD